MAGMDFKLLQENWHKYGQTDPLWSIVSMPDKEGNKWTTEEFFQTGVNEVEKLMAFLKTAGLKLPSGSALDFGCGIGRVTQPLCEHFETCHGVDIAPSMIDLANQYNRYGNRCHYHLNERADLQLFADNSINFIYCVITLQNMAPRYSRVYLQEFMRILAPEGLLLFQIPSEPNNWRQKVKQRVPQAWLNQFYRLKHRGKPIMELHGLPRAEVIGLIKAGHGLLLNLKKDHRAFDEWTSYQYCVTKAEREGAK